MVVENTLIDALIAYLLDLRQIKGQSPRDWLDEASDCMVRALVRPLEGVVCLADVQRGKPTDPWKNVSLGVATTDEDEQSSGFSFGSLFHELEKQSLHPDALISLVHTCGYHHLTPETIPSPKHRRLFDEICSRFRVCEGWCSWGPAFWPENGDPKNKRVLYATIWSRSRTNGVCCSNIEKGMMRSLMHNLWRSVQVHYLDFIGGHHKEQDLLMSRLTTAQRRVADLLVKGLSEKQVAKQLDRSPHTTHDHVKAIYRAWNVRTRAEMIARWANERTSVRAETK